MSQQTGSSVFHIIAFAFQGRKRAMDVSKELRRQQFDLGLYVHAWAVVEVDDKGKPHVHEPGKGGVGGSVGGAGGALLGLVGGPAGLLAWTVAGAVIGGVSGHYMGRWIPAEDLKQLAQEMQPNTSAIIALIENVAAESMLNQMSEYGANVITLTVADEATGAVAEVVAAGDEAASAAESTGAAPASGEQEPAKA
jgi:uncharacterized membrane protein